MTLVALIAWNTMRAKAKYTDVVTKTAVLILTAGEDAVVQ
jgi:hypothetical protein